jgi:hypothetical protein
MQVNPGLKVRDAYHMVVEANSDRMEEQKNELRELRRARKRQRRIIAFQSRVEQMRMAALRKGEEFEPPPEMPLFSDVDENLDELSDIETMFEQFIPQVEEGKVIEADEELPEGFVSSSTSPTNSQHEIKSENIPLELSMLSDSDEEVGKVEQEKNVEANQLLTSSDEEPFLQKNEAEC